MKVLSIINSMELDQGGPPVVLRNQISVINKEKIVHHIEYKNAKKTEILMCFPSQFFYKDEETIYFPLIEMLLSDGLESILLERLRGKLNLIYSLSLEFDTDLTGTTTTIHYSTADKNIKKTIEQTILKLKDFVDGKFKKKRLSFSESKNKK